MTEVLLLAVALLLTLACAVFVAAEFSLTTVERTDLERAEQAGERGAPAALRAVRSLTVQLSGAQLGITVTGLVIGMLAQASIAELLAGPLRALGMSAAGAASLGLVLGTGISTVVLMVVGELVPKNWAISRPLPVAKAVAPPQTVFTAAFGPLIRHLNNTANRVLRRLGMEPAEELASARSPEELVALARHSARAGALEADTAELFVRTLSLARLTAENVMTPASRSSPWRRAPPAGTSPTSPAPRGCPASPSTGAAWTTSSASSTSRTSWPCRTSAGRATRSPRCCGSRCRSPSRSPWTGCWTGCPAR